MYQRYLYLSKLNAVLLPENETFEPSVKKTFTARKANVSLFWNLFYWDLFETIIAKKLFREIKKDGAKSHILKQ